MDVNATKIKELRTVNGWTQQHLADACAISLRTVQRVERYGNASQETVSSLAAVFELQQIELIVRSEVVELVEDKKFSLVHIHTQAVILAGLLGACIGACIMYFIR
jgi:transcriptional regulator with XRE-family HTH domain|tara:strand:- start:622 stop:939 length:318 start_codon:yes stop_codon:yes gene_type:complete